MKVGNMNIQSKQRGAVSLFIVIFTTLLVSIITVGFVRIMLSDQRQASAADLSQSAYDSAQAGVEDAKRALLAYRAACTSGDAAQCAAATTLIDSATCNESLSSVISYVPNEEVMVQQSSGDGALQQAYTCVKITRETDNYIGTISQDDSKVIALSGVSAFNSIRLEWFNAKDIEGTTTKVDVPVFSVNPALLTQAAWTSSATPNRPAIMRTQLMQFGSDFVLSDFEDINASGESNANTLFLFPSTAPDTKKFFTANVRKASTSTGPTQIRCIDNLGSGGYACSATVELPAPIGGGAERTAFLRLTSLYKKSNFRLTLLDGTGTVVKFNGVQPEIDSTGRANDLFRRVQSRVELMDENFPYPDAAVDTSGAFCKDFLVTDDVADYRNSCAL